MVLRMTGTVPWSFSPCQETPDAALLGVTPHFLSAAFPRERLFRTPLVARLQIEGVLLDVLDGVFLLHLSLESAKGALDRLTILNSDFRHLNCHPLQRL